MREGKNKTLRGVSWDTERKVRVKGENETIMSVAQATTANHPTRVAVELSDSSVRPCSLKQDVTAELILYSTSSQATLTSGGRWLWFKKPPPPSPALPSPNKKKKL